MRIDSGVRTPGRNISTDHVLYSNVQLADLRKYYKWEFYAAMYDLEKVPLDALEKTVPFKYLYLIESGSLPVLQLPDDWQVRSVLMDRLTMSITMVSAFKRD